jgi:hypothetical protein
VRPVASHEGFLVLFEFKNANRFDFVIVVMDLECILESSVCMVLWAPTPSTRVPHVLFCQVSAVIARLVG